jgi:hypothetical protein
LQASKPDKGVSLKQFLWLIPTGNLKHKSMKKFLFIGIDFSKSKFDVSVIEEIERKNVAQATFENSETGYRLSGYQAQKGLSDVLYRFSR